MDTGSGRWTAGCVAVVAWAGPALLLFDQTARLGGDVAAALWVNARFFTDLSNLLIALLFTALAVCPSRVPRRLMGMPLVSTLMASVVYYGLLGGFSALGANGTGDVIAHAVTPLLVTGWWLFAAPGEPFRYADVPVWAVFPAGYCLYAIVRGLLDGRYPYFFLNVGRLGAGVTVYILAILLLFGVIGMLVVAIDRRLRPIA